MKFFLRTVLAVAALSFAVVGPARAASYVFTGAVNANWFNVTNWTPQGLPGLSDTVTISNSVTLTNPVVVATFNLSVGTFNASTNGLTIAQGGNWIGGIFGGLVTNNSPAATPFNLNNPGGNLDLPGTTFVNNGNVIWIAGTIRGNGSTVISNNVFWQAQASNGVMNNAYGGTPRFDNNLGATLEVNPTNATVTFNSIALNNYGNGVATGTVDVETGTLQMGGGGTLSGTFTAESGASILLTQGSFFAGNSYTFGGAGSSSLTGGTLMLSNYLSPGFILAGGTVTLGPAFQNSGAITNLTLSGSTLAGTNTLIGTLNWAAGGISGVFTIASTGLLNLSGAGQVIQYASLTNSGEILWNGSGNWEVYNDGGANEGLINNLPGGVILAQCNNSMTTAGNPWFNNAGAFTKSMSAGATSVSLQFTNMGTVSVQSGSLAFGNGYFGGVFQTANGTVLTFNNGGVLAGSFTAAFDASINFTSGTFTETPGIAFAGAGVLQMTGGNFTLLANAPSNLELNGGTINLSPGFQGGSITNFTVTGDTLTGSNVVTGVLNLDGTASGPLVVASGAVLNWSGGSITGGLIISNGGVLNLTGTSNTMVLYSTMTNAGTVNWTGGAFALYTGHAIYNLPGAVFNIQCDQTLYYYNGTESFNNAGLVQKSGTSGTTYLQPIFNNTGSVVVESGTLEFTGLDVNASLGGVFLAETGATINFDSGGGLAGNFTTATGGNIELTGGVFTPFPALSFNGSGSNIMSGGTITLTNAFTANLQLTGGTVLLAPGFQGGTITNLTFSGPSIGGTNTVAGVFNLTGNISGPLTVLSNATLNLDGNINSPVTLVPGATLNWTNGNLAYNLPLTVPAGAVLNVVGPGTVYIEGPFTNAGTINWSGGEFEIESYYYNNAAVYNLAGATFNILGNVSAYDNGLFNNAGLLLKYPNTATTELGWSFNNTGTVDLRTGTLLMEGPIQTANQTGTWLVEAGATLTLDDGGYLTGAFTAAAGATINFTYGTFTNTTTTLLDGAGAYNLNGGTMDLLFDLPGNLALQSGALDPGPGYQGGSISDLFLNGLSLAGSNTVSGVLNVTGNIEGPLTVASGGVVTVNGYIDGAITLQSGAVLNWTGENLDTPVTIALGATLNISPTNYAYLEAPITNSGTINWRGGEVYLDDYYYYGDGLYNLPGGVFSILTDQTIYGFSGDFIHNGGVIRKSATTGITTVNALITNTGVIDAESGTILFTNAYTTSYANSFVQSGGTWDIGINNVTNYGVLAFTTGTAPALPAVLNVSLNNGCILGEGSSFAIVDYLAGTLSGAITTTNLPGGGASWLLSRGTTNLNLVLANLSAPLVGITSPANNAYVVAPSSIPISATAASTNGFAIVSVQFFQGSTLLGQISSPPYTFSWTSVTPGNYTLTAVATDANGGVAGSAPVNITVVSTGPQTTNYIWTGAVSTDWFTAGNWIPNGVPGVLDNAIITNTSAASVNPSLSQNTSVNNVILSGGVVGGPGALTVTNVFTWMGGAISNTVSIPANALLLITGSGFHTLTNAVLINLGEVDWSGGNILGNAGTIITNGGLWLEQSNYNLSLGSASAGGLFVNNGIVRQTTTTGESTYLGGTFVNHGTVDCQSGSLQLADIAALTGAFNTFAGASIFFNATTTLNTTPAITGQGNTEFAGGTLNLLNDWPPLLRLVGGTVKLGPAFQNAGAITNLTLSGSTLTGTNTVTGTFNFVSGTLSTGSLTVEPAGLLTLGGTSGTVYLQSARLINSGEVIWQNGYVGGTGNSYVTNNTLWLNIGGSELYGFSFVNNGTFRQTGAVTSFLYSSPFLNNGVVDAGAGTVQLDGGGSFAGNYNTAAGATIAFGGGTNVLNSLPNFTGVGLFTFDGGTLVMNNDIDPALLLTGGSIVLGPAFQNGSINNLTLQGAMLAGTNTVTGNLTVLSGGISGALTISTHATMTLTSGAFNFPSGELTNFGSVYCVGNTEFDCYGAGPVFLVNNGLWLNQGDCEFYDNFNDNLATYVNNGIYRQQGSGAYSYFEQVAVNNNGLFDVQNGSLYFEDGGALGGTYNVASGAYLYFDDGTFTASQPPPFFTGAGASQIIGGTLLLQNDQIPTLPLTGGIVTLGPNFQGQGAITNLTLAGATLAGTNLVSGTLSLSSGSQFTGNLTVSSNGLLVLSGSGQKELYGSNLVNQGVVDWTGGPILCAPTTVISNLGNWLVETDNTFQNVNYSVYSNLFVNSGTFTKTTTTGATVFQGVSFLNAGTLDVESGSVSLLANNYNSYAQTGATLAFGVNAPNAAGQLLLPTNFNLDGTLLVKSLNGYTPSLGDFIPVITYGSAAGTFANLDLPDVSGGNVWDVEYGASGVNLRVVPGVTNVSTFLISGSVTAQNGVPISSLAVYATQVGPTNLIVNGSFEVPSNNGADYTLYNPGSTSIPGWSVIVNTIDLGSAFEFGPGPSEDGLQFFDPTGSSSTNGGVTQTFSTVPGTTYELVFYHGGASHYSVNNVLGVTIAGNYSTYNETDGSGANFDWRRVEIPFTATATATTVTFLGLLNFNADDNWVDNVQVIPPGLGTIPQAVTDSTGHYQISVPNGTFQVGVGGLVAAGYNPVATVNVPISGANGIANFMATPAASGELFTIATSVNPPALGTTSGGGTGFYAGTAVTVVATQLPNALPYYFAGWTENGVLESTNLGYSFFALRNRVLVANFALPGLVVAASNNPPADGIVTGAGIYTYNTTSVLTAFPYAGYKFLNWTENGAVVGTSASLSTLVLTDHSFVANYADANSTHVVTTATSPAGLGTVTGAGTYSDGQTAIITAPAALTNNSQLYLFQGFTSNGVSVASAASFSKTFSTFDPAALEFVAVYRAYPLQPQIIGVADNYPNPIPATTGFLLTFQFDRSMRTSPAPLVVLTNSAPGAVQAVVGSNGLWTTTVFANDTYQTPGITFGNKMDGTVQVLVSGAQDVYGHVLAVTNVTNLVVHSTPPPAPVVTISNPTNGAIFSAAAGFAIDATAISTNVIREVDFYANGVLLGVNNTSPYSWTANGLNQGSYSLTAVAIDQSGLSATSAVVHVTVEGAGERLIDFEALDASQGGVGGAGLSNYLYGYGVVASNVTPSGAGLAVEDDLVFLGGGAVRASSGDNFLAEMGASGAVSYTLGFSQGYASVSWVRTRLLAGTTGASLPAWRAHAFNAAGQEIGSVGESAAASFADIPAAAFTLLGPGLVSIRFDGNNGGASALSTLPLDDLLLSTVAVNTTLAVQLTQGAGTVLTAPATVVLSAAVSDSLAAVTNVQFYEGGNLVGSAAPTGGVAVTTLRNVAAGSYVFTAVASDSGGTVVTSAGLALTVGAGAGVGVINFDSLNTAGGSVGGVLLSNYLYGFGVVMSNVTVGTALESVSGGLVTGGGGAVASSPPNYFTQEGLNTPVSFTLRFGGALANFGLTRVGLLAGAGGVTHPQWEATAYDAAGVELGAVGEGLIVSATNVPARSFVLGGVGGDGIAWVRFDSDSQKTAAFSAVLLDDLILYTNAGLVAPGVAVALLNPPGGASFVAPASIPLSAGVTDNLGASYYVNFYAGPNLVGSVSNAPYNFVWTNVLAGSYALRAEAVDASGVAAYSSPVNVTVQSGGNSTVVNFDALNATTGPVTGAVLNTYLQGFGMSVTGLSAGTELAVANQGLLAGGGAVAASSPPNVVTQTGGSGPVSYTVNFTPWLGQFGLTRPELLAAPYVSHPGWTMTVYDAAGAVLGQAGEDAIGSYSAVGARGFTVNGGGAGIASVQIASAGNGLTTFNGMVADDFVLTGAGGVFPPAVAITNPVSGLALTGPVPLTVGAAAAAQSGGLAVSFYVNNVLIGAPVTSPPYQVEWTNRGTGGYALTAVASNLIAGGLSRTSAVVNVTVLPPAYEFGILTGPASQTNAVGSSASFAVVISGTNVVTYQWNKNGSALGGQTGPNLTIFPVGPGDGGDYTVTVTPVDSAIAPVTSAGAVLTVAQPPMFVVQPMSQTVGIGANVDLTNLVQGAGPLQWQWLLNGTGIAGATASNYLITAAQPLNSGNYQVVAGNAVAAVASAVAAVTVTAGNGVAESANTFAGRISINPLLGPVMGSTVGAGTETGDPAQIVGKPAGNLIWYTWTAGFTGVISLTTLGSDFDTLLGVYTGTNLTQLTSVAQDDDSGGYFTSLVTFNVSAGTVYQIAVGGFKGASGSVILGMPSGTGYRVLNAATGNSVPVITSQPTNQLVVAGSKVTISATAGGSGPLSYQWYFDGAPVAAATNTSLVLTNFQPGAVGVYSLLVANAVGSVQSGQASVQIASGSTTSAEDKFGDAVDLAGGAAPQVAEKPGPAGGGDTRGFSVSQTFSTVGATKETGEPNHCGQAGGASQWYIYTAPVAGTLRVSTAGSTFNTILAVYTVPGNTVATNFASLVAQGCGFTTNYQTQGQPEVVIPGVTSGTRFYIAVDGYNGASGRAQLAVGLGAAPTLLVMPVSRQVTAGSNAVFTVSAIGSTNLYYQWQLNGVALARATNASFTASQAGSYTVVVSNMVGVVTSAPPAVLSLQFAPGITAEPTNVTATLGKKAGFVVGAVGVNTKTNPFHYQWYQGGALVRGATGSSLEFAAVQWTNRGSYSVVVSNSYGMATSAPPAVLMVLDTVLPVAAITTPSVNNFVTLTNPVLVAGTASDKEVALAQVEVEDNQNGFQTAAGTAKWSTNILLTPGANVITARSLDVAGNLSAPVRRTIIYEVGERLTLLANGVGKISSTDGAVNNALLIVGSRYHVTAANITGSGYLFSNWESGTSLAGLTNAAAAAACSFLMQTNLIVQANFAANPFPAAAGTYNGLFAPVGGVTEASSGFLRATLPGGGTGAYSAVLLLAGQSNSFSGTFDVTGHSQTNLTLAGKNVVSVQLQMPLYPANNQLTGTVSSPAAGWNSVLQAWRAVFNTTTQPATSYAGQYTIFLPPGPNAPVASPDGYSYAVISNTLGGVAGVVGTLADGTTLSQSVGLGPQGTLPLYQSLDKGAGSVQGWITFAGQPNPAVTGQLTWIKPAASGTLYPLGFTNAAIPILGSLYTNATVAGTGLPAFDPPEGTLTLNNGNLAAPLIYHLGLGVNNSLTNLGGAGTPSNPMTIQINPNNGQVTVTFQATGGKTNVAQGAILQTQTNALGAFRGSTQSGSLLVK